MQCQHKLHGHSNKLRRQHEKPQSSTCLPRMRSGSDVNESRSLQRCSAAAPVVTHVQRDKIDLRYKYTPWAALTHKRHESKVCRWTHSRQKLCFDKYLCSFCCTEEPDSKNSKKPENLYLTHYTFAILLFNIRFVLLSDYNLPLSLTHTPTSTHTHTQLNKIKKTEQQKTWGFV